MTDRRPFASLGHERLDWLDTRYHFSFAGYHDPARMAWGGLRVWNDGGIGPGSGVPPHPPRGAAGVGPPPLPAERPLGPPRRVGERRRGRCRGIADPRRCPRARGPAEGGRNDRLSAG